MCLCACAHMPAGMCLCMSACVSAYLCMYTCLCACACVSVLVSVHVSLHVCVCLHACVCETRPQNDAAVICHWFLKWPVAPPRLSSYINCPHSRFFMGLLAPLAWFVARSLISSFPPPPSPPSLSLSFEGSGFCLFILFKVHREKTKFLR